MSDPGDKVGFEDWGRQSLRERSRKSRGEGGANGEPPSARLAREGSAAMDRGIAKGGLG